jgi:hypothetical protein
MDDDKLTPEESLLEQIYGLLIKVKDQYRAVLGTKRITLVLCAVNFVLMLALQYQITTRNERLEKIEDATAELRSATLDLQESVNEIKVIATGFRDNAQSSAQSNAAVARGLGQIDLICLVVGCPVPQP